MVERQKAVEVERTRSLNILYISFLTSSTATQRDQMMGARSLWNGTEPRVASMKGECRPHFINWLDASLLLPASKSGFGPSTSWANRVRQGGFEPLIQESVLYQISGDMHHCG